MMQIVSGIKVWFASIIDTVPVVADVKPYILNTLTRFDFNGVEKNSIVIARCDAKSFVDQRDIGDFAFWKSSFTQGYAHQGVVESIGRMAYYDCYRMSGRRTIVFEFIADELPELTKQIHIRVVAPLTTNTFIDT